MRVLADMMKEITGYRGDVVWDADKPDGTPRKALDGSVLSALGWRALVPLKDGLKRVYAWYQQTESLRTAA